MASNKKKIQRDYSAQYARYGQLMNSDLVLYGMFISVALLVSYLESLIPLYSPIPGIKLGLANAVIVWVLYVSDWKGAAVVSLLRVVIAGILFGNFYSLAFSAVGAVMSLTVMTLLKKFTKLKMLGVSIVGAVMHNVGQILVAIAVLNNGYMIMYLPILLISGVISGLMIGLLAGLVYGKLRLAAQKNTKKKTSENSEESKEA